MRGSVDGLKARQGPGFLRPSAVVCLVISGILLVGCGGSSDGGSPNRPELNCDAQVPVVTTNDIQSQIMTPVCMSCHAPGGGVGAPGQWETADKTYNGTVGKPSTYSGLPIIDPRNLKNSVMYLKVLGGSPPYRGPGGENVGGPMPDPPRPVLTQTQKTLMKNWICGGALR
jgi:hypothetical protein